MSKEKYVAYVGTYTHENSIGIYVYDIDPETGVFTEKGVAPINNASDLCASKDGKFLYSIEDEGVASFSIDKDGMITKINSADIDGMRGCCVTTDYERRYLFVGGFHDGKVTMMKLNEDGSIGGIADGIFHQGVAISANDRRLDHPKVSSVRLTPEQDFLLAADYGLNQVKVYKIDYKHGKLALCNTIRCNLDSGPRSQKFSKDGRFLYILDELTNEIEVYKYSVVDDEPDFERIQVIESMEGANLSDLSCELMLSHDQEYVYVSIDAFNGVSWLKRDTQTGLLTHVGQMPTSGYFPKTLAVLPGDKYIAMLNHDSNEIRTFVVNHENETILLKNAPVKVGKPNSIWIQKL